MPTTPLRHLASARLRARPWILVALGLPGGCFAPPPADMADSEADTSTTAGASSVTGDDEEPGVDDGDSDAIADIGDPQIPTDECVAVTQTATLEERPVDAPRVVEAVGVGRRPGRAIRTLHLPAAHQPRGQGEGEHDREGEAEGQTGGAGHPLAA